MELLIIKSTKNMNRKKKWLQDSENLREQEGEVAEILIFNPHVCTHAKNYIDLQEI